MSQSTAPPASASLFLSPADERANTLTHGIGFLLSCLAIFGFWQLTAGLELGLRICCALYSVSMAIVYLFSTLSHAVTAPKIRNQLRAWDQGTIYGLIAGTYTPFIWQGSPEGYRTAILTAVWVSAAVGFYSKVLTKHRINAISTVTYVLLGWLPALPLLGRTPMICFVGMILGGAFYTGGILFLIRSQRVRYAHAAWHIMVMLGSTCHCCAIILLLKAATVPVQN